LRRIDPKNREVMAMHNKITNVAILYIITAIFYNFISVENAKLNFITEKFIDDIWFVIEYGIVAYLFYYLRANIYAKIAMWVTLFRFIYNLGILVDLIEYKAYFESYFVPCLSILLLTYFKLTKWQI